MTERAHILGTFDSALQALRDDVFTMAAVAQRNLANAMRGLLERDNDLCNLAIADDEEIDQLEKQVDKDGIELLLRFQPMASDLRQVVSAMKLSSNIERVGDQAVNIARKARKLNQAAALPDLPRLDPMFQLALAMFKDSVKSFAEGDVAAARLLKGRDRELDQMNSAVGTAFTEEMARIPERIQDYLNLIFIARHLERVGDHATNIGEDTVYAFAAEDIRHLPRQGSAEPGR